MTQDMLSNDAMKRVADKIQFHKEAGDVAKHAAETSDTVRNAVMDRVNEKEAVYQQLLNGAAAKKTSREKAVMERVNEKEALYKRFTDD